MTDVDKTRLEFLKAYVFAVLHKTGAMIGAATYKEVIQQIGIDLPMVLAEMAQVYAEQSGQKIASAVLGKAQEVIADVGRRGFKNVWDDLQATYKRGAKVKAKRR